MRAVVINGFHRGAVGHGDGELALVEHFGERALPAIDGERVAGIVPMEGDGGINAFFIVVVVALVFGEGEGGVGTG